MKKYICQISGNKTVMEAILDFCDEMFDGECEIDYLSIKGNPFSNTGMSFSLRDGRNYKIFYHDSMKVFKLFEDSEI